MESALRVCSRFVGMLLLLAVSPGSSLGGQSGVPAIELSSVTLGGSAGGGQEYLDETSTAISVV